MKAKKAFDVVVIGGGPGGYAAAIHAAHLGADVAIIERDRIGGTCLNRGCVPMIFLQRASRLLSRIRDAEGYGISVEVDLDLEAMQRRRDEVIEEIAGEMEVSLKREGVELIEGTAAFLKPGLIEVSMEGGRETLVYKSAIIATGSQPDRGRLGVSAENVLTTDEALDLGEIPRSIAVIGGGAVATSLACAFMNLGSEVFILEDDARILDEEDEEIALGLQDLLGSKGMKIFTNARVTAVGDADGGRRVFMTTPSGDREIKVEEVLTCQRAPNIGGIGLELIGVETERGRIAVNDRMETNVSAVYAVGDVVGRQMLAHVASAEGMVAAENAVGGEAKVDYRVIPKAIYSTPEVASVGLTQERARSQGYRVKASKFSLAQNTYAKIIGEAEGVIKAVADVESEEVLGVHILGSNAFDMISECALAMRLEATIEDIVNAVYAHPTRAEAIRDVFWKMYRALHYD
ncbi:MAG: dihydrolipoyl dehydrogenase [Candidatus Geothermarchaeales archaeon]